METAKPTTLSAKTRWLGHHAEGFIWPLWLCVVVYLGPERWLHTDSAYTLFRILNHQDLFYDRFACELLVWPGQLLSHLGAPLHWVLQSLNLILPLMAWLIWLLAVRSPYRWTLFLLFFTGGSEAFFIGYSEIGLSTLAFLSTAIFMDSRDGCETSARSTRLNMIFISVGWLIMLTAHPAGWLYAPILIGLNLVYLPKSQNLVLFLVFSTIFSLKSWLLPSNAYDRGLYETLFSGHDWKSFGSLWSLQYLKGASWFFIPAVTAIAALLIGLTKPWRWISLLFFGIALIATIIALLIYSQGDAHINMEKFFYPVALISMLSIPAYLWASERPQFGQYRLQFLTAKQREFSRSLIGILPWFLALSMLLGIQKHSAGYANRIQQLQGLIGTMHHNKMVAHYDTLSLRVFPGSLWGLSYETALVSMMDKKAKSRDCVRDETKTMKPMTTEELLDWTNIEKRIGDSLLIGAPFEMPQPIAKLNQRYFRFKTKTTYQRW